MRKTGQGLKTCINKNRTSMKTAHTLVALLFISSMISCSKDEDVAPSRLNHSGEKWKIVSLDYTIVDQSFSNPMEWVKKGTVNDAGAFYFDGSKGSFNMLINDDRLEDYYGYTMDESSVSIVTVEQSVSPSHFSQNVIAFSGDVNGTAMTLSGTFTRQGGLSQYVFTGDFVLAKE